MTQLLKESEMRKAKNVMNANIHQKEKDLNSKIV